MKLLIAAVLVVVVGCGNLVAPKSGYGVPNAGDPSDSGKISPDEGGCAFGYNIASGRACGDSSAAVQAARGKHPVVSFDCRSGYIIAYDRNGNPECVPE